MGSPGASSSSVPLLAISALARSRMQLQSSAHGRRIIETGKRENIVAELVAFMPWLWPMEKTSKTVPRSLNFLQRRPTVSTTLSLLENCSRLKTSRLFRKLRLRKRSFEASLRDGCSTSAFEISLLCVSPSRTRSNRARGEEFEGWSNAWIKIYGSFRWIDSKPIKIPYSATRIS